MAASKVILNKNKTEYMIIGSHLNIKNCDSDFLIEIKNTPIKRVGASKSLGVVLHETLIWRSQVELIIKKVNRGFQVRPEKITRALRLLTKPYCLQKLSPTTH